MGIFPHYCKCGFKEEFLCKWQEADDVRLCPDCGEKLKRQIVTNFVNDYKPTHSRHTPPPGYENK